MKFSHLFLSSLTLSALTLLTLASCGVNSSKAVRQEFAQAAQKDTAVVYFIKEITPENLVKLYDALGVTPQGKVAVKISTGEAGGHNYLKPELIGGLVSKVKGTIVECNTAYPGKRMTTESHLKVIEEHGFTAIASVEIMDAEGEIKIPVVDSTWIKYDKVGAGVANYDFMIDLAHFKGHGMGGFGGVLKNLSIGVASASGKAYIHSAGTTQSKALMWTHLPKGWTKKPENNDPFIEAMAAAAQAVHNYYNAKEGIVYINVMNNLSVDCDCVPHPAEPLMLDRGMMASLDPVAVDKACLDVVFGSVASEGDDNGPLTERINSRHGTHIVEYGEKIGLGTMTYKIIEIE